MDDGEHRERCTSDLRLPLLPTKQQSGNKNPSDNLRNLFPPFLRSGPDPMHAIYSIQGLATCFVSVALFLPSFAQESDKTKAQAAHERALEKFEEAIKSYEKQDESEVASKNTILFLGSSSIRLWESMAEDLKPWPVVRRGYGGAKFSDLAVFAPRLLKAHHPRAVVIYVGNDITGNAVEDKSPEEVVQLFESVAATIRNQHAPAEIFLIAITPAPKRFEVWPKTKEANTKLKQACERGERMHFIETESKYLTSSGEPKPELYRDDRLHQNSDGYKIWSSIIRSALEVKLGSPTVNE
jgi:lysophospholipase L1-like esterase